MGAIRTRTSCKSGWYSCPALPIQPRARLKRTVGRSAYSKQDLPECMNSDTRLLTTVYSNATGMTNEVCAVDCAGSQYFGTQWSIECWCGSSLAAGSSAAPSTDCSYACSGNASEICGGSRRLSLYQLISSNSSATTATSVASSTTSSS